MFDSATFIFKYIAKRLGRWQRPQAVCHKHFSLVMSSYVSFYPDVQVIGLNVK